MWLFRFTCLLPCAENSIIFLYAMVLSNDKLSINIHSVENMAYTPNNQFFFFVFVQK